MAYLYQAINNVPGLSGSSYQKQQQLYAKMGSPYGAYKGTAQQNNWLLSQINSGAATKAMSPQPTPKPAAAAPAKNTAKDIANQAGAGNVYKGPVFEEVLPFYKAWEGLLPMVQQEAESEINPGMQRQLRQASENIYNQMAGGGGRFGSSWGQLGDAYAQNEQQRKSLTADWLNQRRQGFKSLWYDPSQTAFNRAIELGQTPGAPKIPTYAEYQKMLNPTTPSPGGDNKDDDILAPGETGPARPPYTMSGSGWQPAVGQWADLLKNQNNLYTTM